MVLVLARHYKLRHHVNMQFNQISTTSYAMQQEMEGMISQEIGREIIQTLEPIVLSQMSIRKPIKFKWTPTATIRGMISC